MQIIIFMSFLFLFITTYSFPILDIGGSFGAADWPRVILIIGMILTLISMYKIVVLKKYISSSFTKIQLIRFAIASMIMIIYVVLVKPLGFIVTTPFMVAAYIYQMGIRKPLHILFFSLFISFVFVFLFGRLLQVNLPRGTGLIRVFSFYLY